MFIGLECFLGRVVRYERAPALMGASYFIEERGANGDPRANREGSAYEAGLALKRGVSARGAVEAEDVLMTRGRMFYLLRAMLEAAVLNDFSAG